MPYKLFPLSRQGKNSQLSGNPAAVIPDGIGPKIPAKVYVEMEIWPDGAFTSEIVRESLIEYGIPANRTRFENQSPTSRAFSPATRAGAVIAMVRQSQFDHVIKHLCKTCPGVSVGTRMIDIERFDGVKGEILRFEKVKRLICAVVEWSDLHNVSTHPVKDLSINDKNVYVATPPPNVQQMVEDVKKNGLAGEARWESL